MSILKSTVILTFFILSSISGPLYTAYLKKEFKYIDKVINSLQYMSDIIEYRKLTLFQSIEECYQKEQLIFLKNILNITDKNTNYSDIWKKSIQQDSEISPEFKSILIDFGTILGKTNLKSQIKFFSYYINQLKELNNSKKIKLSSNVKLYNAMGVLLGAFVVIIFI